MILLRLVRAYHAKPVSCLVTILKWACGVCVKSCQFLLEILQILFNLTTAFHVMLVYETELITVFPMAKLFRKLIVLLISFPAKRRFASCHVINKNVFIHPGQILPNVLLAVGWDKRCGLVLFCTILMILKGTVEWMPQDCSMKWKNVLLVIVYLLCMYGQVMSGVSAVCSLATIPTVALVTK